MLQTIERYDVLSCCLCCSGQFLKKYGAEVLCKIVICTKLCCAHIIISKLCTVLFEGIHLSYFFTFWLQSSCFFCHFSSLSYNVDYFVIILRLCDLVMFFTNDIKFILIHNINKNFHLKLIWNDQGSRAFMSICFQPCTCQFSVRTCIIHFIRAVNYLSNQRWVVFYFGYFLEPSLW